MREVGAPEIGEGDALVRVGRAAFVIRSLALWHMALPSILAWRENRLDKEQLMKIIPGREFLVQ